MNSIDRLIEKIEKTNDEILKNRYSDFKKLGFKEITKEFTKGIIEVFNYYNENKEEKIPAFLNAVWDYEDDGITLNSAVVLDDSDNVIAEIDLSKLLEPWNRLVSSKLEKGQLDEKYFVLHDLSLKKAIELGEKAGADAVRSNEFKRIKDRIEEYEYFGGVQKSLAIELGEVDGDISGIIFSWEDVISEEGTGEKEAEFLVTEGEEFYNNGEISNAVECFNEAKEIFEELMEYDNEFSGAEVYAACLMNLGNCYAFELNNTNAAIENYEKCIKISEKLNKDNRLEDKIMLGSVYIYTACEYIVRSEYERAGYYLAAGIKYLSSLEEQNDEIKNLLLYAAIKEGEVYSALGKHIKSIEKYKEGLVLNEGEDHETEAELLFRIGKEHLAAGEQENARYNLMRAKEIMEQEKIKDESYEQIIKILG